MPQHCSIGCSVTRREDHDLAILTAPNRRPLARPPILEIQWDQFDGSHHRLMHNHPSGDPTPSQADIQMTKAIIDIAAPLGYPCTITSLSARTVMQHEGVAVDLTLSAAQSAAAPTTTF